MEKEIIRLVCAEKTSEEISKDLFIGKRTIEGMRSRILSKAKVKSNIGLVIFAIKNAIYFVDNY